MNSYMKGSINTRNKVLSKFKSSITSSIPDEAIENIDVDFTTSMEGINDDTAAKKFDVKEYRLLGDDDLDIRRKSIKKGIAIIIEFKIIKNNDER